MNRFSKKKTGRGLRAIVLPAACFLIVLALFFAGVQKISATTKSQELDSLQTAIHRNIVHCYAVEGQYPPSLDYMEDHYGLSYDASKYFIDYQPSAANIMPSVTIIPLEDEK